MIQRNFSIAVALLLATACGKKKKEQQEPAPEQREVSAKSDGECASRIDAITKRIAPFQHGIRTLGVPPAKLTIPIAAGARPLDARGPVVTSDLNTLAIAGERIGSVDALGERLTRDKRAAVIAAEGNESAMPQVYFQVDGTLPVAALLELVAQTPAGVAARLLVTRPGVTESYEAEATTPATVRTLLRELRNQNDPAERAVFLANAMQEAIKGCAPIVRLFGALATMPVDDKHRALVTGFGPALRECACRGVDLDVLEVFLLEVSDAYRQPQGWLPLAFDPKAKLKLHMPAEANARDLAAALEKLPPATLEQPIALTLGK